MKSLKWPDGMANPAGIKAQAFYIKKTDIKTYPVLKENPETTSEEVTYEGDYELNADAHAISIYTTQGKGKVDFETAGEKDCKAITNKAELSYPDMNDEGVAFVSKTVNSNGIFIIPYYVAGGKLAHAVLGHKDFDSEVTPKGTSGQKPGDAKGITIEVSAPDYYALPRYVGTLTLDDGTYDCATGTFTPKTTP